MATLAFGVSALQWTGGSQHSNTVVFSLGQRAGLMSECGLLFVSWGL